ncbi:phosphate ABC transporter permease subunit PstC [Paracoccus yeei]|jgi:phosphate transport system permease protein|uniref:Phosphate transport system permease protein n=1 Tax=Paracoccus yeei TaxID=147645 RepID=A0A1V0GU93_9RHOB|nr:phosphate ABC transporter permease subunit PstC [Paracoccus yeei]ARC37445.1 phosphate ABC transporter permease subunit PstC [Paracoccus yeei]OWJ95259.1 phosphate ABC transporter permease subunit PstC [Paracoccus yeei]
MPVTWTLLIVLALAAAGFYLGRSRALAAAQGDSRKLHSRTSYYGWNIALFTAVPALFLIAIWSFAQPDVNRTVLAGVALILAAAGMAWSLSRTAPDFRARNVVETFVRFLLILCSSIAILTTAGIVLSMLFETGHFFQQYPWQDFLFGTTWSPRFGGGSQLGILPLVWGTLYISLIALAVSIPIGLFAAIYMSEYASPRLRSIAKPAIEVLAGIPTIVYGLFALITVGPMLRDYFAQPLGLGSSGSSVMTAGLVMGIMLIPFVSSLSDDIINAVPQSLRDGALGLGSTPSETVRKVVLPAALPGIVGAVLLAASRAIGETMIVVLGAGASAQMSLNPFEAMTTITVKIVSQLTGDTDFAAPETLVAFALGITLFIVTLGLNIVALYIVRKYREQYE